MKALVYYVDFHWDNYQGGSGKSFEMRKSIDIPDNLKAGEIVIYVSEELTKHIHSQRPFQQKDTAFTIQKVELV